MPKSKDTKDTAKITKTPNKVSKPVKTPKVSKKSKVAKTTKSKKITVDDISAITKDAKKTTQDLLSSNIAQDSSDIIATHADPSYPPYTEEELLFKQFYFEQLSMRWASFSLSIQDPSTVDIINPPTIIMPEQITNSNEYEFVYPIEDYGNILSTSKCSDMYISGSSMCKLYFTIEKIIYLLVEKLKALNIDEQTPVHIEFDGYYLAQRKAFESVINLSYNVSVTNFDPEQYENWGDRYLKMVKKMGEQGYGYPDKSPRFDVYHRSYSQTSDIQKSKS